MTNKNRYTAQDILKANIRSVSGENNSCGFAALYEGSTGEKANSKQVEQFRKDLVNKMQENTYIPYYIVGHNNSDFKWLSFEEYQQHMSKSGSQIDSMVFPEAAKILKKHIVIVEETTITDKYNNVKPYIYSVSFRADDSSFNADNTIVLLLKNFHYSLIQQNNSLPMQIVLQLSNIYENLNLDSFIDEENSFSIAKVKNHLKQDQQILNEINTYQRNGQADEAKALLSKTSVDVIQWLNDKPVINEEVLAAKQIAIAQTLDFLELNMNHQYEDQLCPMIGFTE
jgi:hypothetical protein